MTSPNTIGSQSVQPIQPSVVKQNDGVENEGRNYKVLKTLGKVALGVVAVAALVAIVVGVVLAINPAGFGIGNFIGGGIASAGLLLGGAVVKLAGWTAANALIIAIAGAVGVVASVATAVAIVKCKKNDDQTQEIGDLSEDQVDVDGNGVNELAPAVNQPESPDQAQSSQENAA